MNPEDKHDLLTQGPATAFSWVGLLSYLFAMPVEKWFALAGTIWIVVQIVTHIWRTWLRAKHEAERVARGLPPPGHTTRPGKL